MATDAQSAQDAPPPPERAKSEFELGHDDPNAYALTIVGVVGVLAVYLIIMGSMGMYLYFEQLEIERKVYAAPHREYEAYLSRDVQVLVDPQQAALAAEDEEEAEEIGRRVSIEQTMDLALRSARAMTGAGQTQPGDE